MKAKLVSVQGTCECGMDVYKGEKRCLRCDKEIDWNIGNGIDPNELKEELDILHIEKDNNERKKGFNAALECLKIRFKL